MACWSGTEPTECSIVRYQHLVLGIQHDIGGPGRRSAERQDGVEARLRGPERPVRDHRVELQQEWILTGVAPSPSRIVACSFDGSVHTFLSGQVRSLEEGWAVLIPGERMTQIR